MGNYIYGLKIMGWRTYYLPLSSRKRGTKLSTPDQTTPGLDYKDEATTSAVDDNSMKTGTTFANIVHGNHPSKLVARVNPVIYAQNKNFPQKKQVARFTLARWKLY